MSDVKTINELFDYLPHRYPFLIDRVVETKAASIKGFKCHRQRRTAMGISVSRYCGVLILEAMAQLSGVLAFETG